MVTSRRRFIRTYIPTPQRLIYQPFDSAEVEVEASPTARRYLRCHAGASPEDQVRDGRNSLATGQGERSSGSLEVRWVSPQNLPCPPETVRALPLLLGINYALFWLQAALADDCKVRPAALIGPAPMARWGHSRYRLGGRTWPPFRLGSSGAFQSKPKSASCRRICARSQIMTALASGL